MTTHMNCVHPKGYCPWSCEGYVKTCPIPAGTETLLPEGGRHRYANNPVVQLEHAIEWLQCHLDTECLGEYCTMHNRSDHSMRSFPQNWRSDRGIMERICPHGIGHVDPDEVTEDRVHGCDGCCSSLEEDFGGHDMTENS